MNRWYVVSTATGYEVRESEDNLNARHDPIIADSIGSESTAQLIAAAPGLLDTVIRLREALLEALCDLTEGRELVAEGMINGPGLYAGMVKSVSAVLAATKAPVWPLPDVDYAEIARWAQKHGKEIPAAYKTCDTCDARDKGCAEDKTNGWRECRCWQPRSEDPA